MTSDTETTVFTQELRVSTPEENRFRVTAGGFYSDLILKERNDYNYPGNIEAAARRIEAREKLKGTLRGAGKNALKLATVLQKAGPVSRIGEVFQLQPDGEVSHPVAGLQEDLSRWLSLEMELPAKSAASLIQCKKEIERQIIAIEAGEQAANARLQAAIESLEPVVDYHTYSTGRTSQ